MDERLRGERKQVSVLFADVVGSTTLAEQADPEEWTDALQPVLRAMAGAVAAFGGTVAQFQGDGLLALFGAPETHEDDPERAVRAGLAMVAAVDALRGTAPGTDAQIRIRVGINTGMVVVGELGTPERPSYTALGDTVNVAARLQAEADPGAVLVGPATHRFVAALFDTRDRGPRSLRGKAAPVSAYEIVGPAAAPDRSRGIVGLASRLVGRDAELARLAELASTAAHGRGRCAVVVGEPGIGKTRLLTELRAAIDPTVVWVEARCLSYGTTLPHHLVRELIDALGGPEAIEREPAGPSADAPDPADVLRHLLGLEIAGPTRQELAALERAGLRRASVASLRALLRSASRHAAPLVVVLEDLHWADPSSAELLAELVPAITELPVLLVLTMRPEHASPGWEVAVAARRALGMSLTELELRPLTADESRDLVRNLLALEHLPGALRDDILARGEGVPYFIEEVIGLLIDEGVIRQRDGRWEAGDQVAPASLPDTLQGLLLGRIDRLPPEARRTLRRAAVIGRTFDETLLTAVAGPDAAAGLAASEAAGLIRLDRVDGRLGYRFSHALLQEAAYESLLRQERRDLHGAVARALETTLADPPTADELGLLALHYERAGEIEPAVQFLAAAGAAAAATYAVREARTAFDRALRLLPADDAQRRRRVELGLARERAGDTFIPATEQLASLDALLPDAEALGDRRLLAEVHAAIAGVRDAAGESYRTSEPLRRAIEHVLRAADELEDPLLAARGQTLLASSRLDQGDYREVIALLDEAVPALAAAGEEATAGLFGAVEAVAHARLGDFDAADRLLAEATERARRSGDRNRILDVELYAGFVEAERGRLDEAITLLARATSTADEIGNLECSTVGHFWLGDVQLRLGRPDLALPALSQSQEQAAYCNMAGIDGLSRAWLAAARADLGDAGDALRELDVALERTRTQPYARAQVLARRALVRASAVPPQVEGALADLAEGASILERLDARPALMRTRHLEAILLRTFGRDAAASDALEASRALAEDLRIAPDSYPEPLISALAEPADRAGAAGGVA